MPDNGAQVELPEVENKLVTASNPVIARVVGNEPCTFGKSNAWIRNISLDVSGTPLAGAFHAGQAFGVIAPGQDDRGRTHRLRLYSIASPEVGEDGKGDIICTPVKRVVDEHWNRGSEPDVERRHGLFMGVCSNYLCDLQIGDEVKITGPVGKRFLLPTHPERHNHVFVATGTGIAPFRGMVLELLQGPAGNAGCEIWLLMGSPYTTDLLYHELFLELADKYSNFHYRQAISREPGPNGSRGMYVDAIIEREQDRLGKLLSDEHTVLYLCGLVGLQINVYRRLAALGLLDAYAVDEKGALGPDPSAWEPREIKRALRATERCMIEVY
jgi:ferredoxin--NADP+ reductase